MQASATVIAAQLQHGLSAGVLASWDSRLARTPRVLVPIKVDALVVRKPGGTWADVAMTAPEPGSAPAAPDLLAQPFAEREPRPPGVYLHWALPDALTRGVGTASVGDVSFPAIPDRWLVVRISSPYTNPDALFPAGGTRRQVTGWVIEAGDAEPVITPLDQWTETADPDRTDTPGKEPLTALGYGDAGWSAYYDNVEGRLGFYDDLSGLGVPGDANPPRSGQSGPLAYLVCGWHSRHLDDPIGEGLTSPSAFQARLDELGWEINPADIEAAFAYADNRAQAAVGLGLQVREALFVRTDTVSGRTSQPGGVLDRPVGTVSASGSPPYGRWLARTVSWPEFCLYHGAVIGLGWPGPDLGPGLPSLADGLLGGPVGGPPSADAVTVTVGNTLTEALAARLAANQGAPDQARVLEAVLLGATEELDLPDSAARIDSRLHASGFAGLPGGSGTEQIVQRPSVPPTSVVADPAATDPGVFGSTPASSSDAAPTGSQNLKGSVSAPIPGQLVGRLSQSVTERISPSTGSGSIHDVIAQVGELRAQQSAVLAQLTGIGVRVPRSANSDSPAEVVDAARAQPRFFVPADPVFLIEGGGRSFKHGSDADTAESGLLVCRLSGQHTTSLTPSRLSGLPGGPVTGRDLLDRGVDHGGVPPECDDLLGELALLDPGSAPIAAGTRFAGNGRFSAPVLQQVAQVYAVEQSVVHLARDERRDSAPLLAISGLAGTLPSPVAVALPIQPWVPLHLDWTVELLPLPGWESWQLGEVDFDADTDALPAVGAPAAQTLSGRALLGAGAAHVASATVRRVLEQARSTAGSTTLTPGTRSSWHSRAAAELVGRIAAMITPARQNLRRGLDGEGAARDATGTRDRLDAQDQSDLDHIADELDAMDVLVGAMDRFTTTLRAGFGADGVSSPGDGSVPDGFWPVRGGFARVTRLRLVDCFGQILDLAGSDDQTPADPTAIMTTEPLTVTDRPDLIELAPRFTAPTRLWFRFTAADGSVADGTEATDALSPVCGFLLPDHLDGDLQFYGSDGTGLGVVRFDGGRPSSGAAAGPDSGDVPQGAGVVWEDAPGRPSTVGSRPAAAIGNTYLAGIAQGLLDWGVVDAAPTDQPGTSRDTALSSLLRIIDTSLWAVDPFGHIGEEHLALLLGHPVAVLRALVRVEVAEPVAPGPVQGVRVPVRIGALAHWQDGLLGYFVGSDFRTLHLPDPAAADFARPVGPNEGFNGQAMSTSSYYTDFAADLGVVSEPGATPVDHPYLDSSGLLWVQPGQDVMITLLMEPHSVVHATCGFLPRKEIGMRRGWVAPGLSKLAPSFRFGPVLLDPKLIRMPVPSDIRGTWSWSHRKDATSWADDPIVNSTGDARIPPDPSEAQEGWLTLTPEAPE